MFAFDCLVGLLCYGSLDLVCLDYQIVYFQSVFLMFVVFGFDFGTPLGFRFSDLPL